jgi:predicted nucleotidyltransferase
MKLPLVKQKKLVVDLLSALPEVRAVYLFGSHADGTATQHSDIDIAALFTAGLSDSFYVEQQLYLGGKLCMVLERDDVDFVVLNRATSIELKFSIIQDGELLFERDPNLVEYEIRIKHEYFDHLAALKRAGF